MNNIETAPRNGEEIVGIYEDNTEVIMFWSERPVCMLGSRNGGFPERWATCGEDTDYNLPLDEPKYWKESL